MTELISIIVPVYNEEELINSTINRLQSEVNDWSYNHEIIYVNDGSNDVYWFYASSSDTATAFSADSNFPDFPMYFDRGLYLSGGVSNGSGGGGIAGSWKVAVIRVR